MLSVNDADFLGGSFARHTKIRPLDDIDLYLPLDGGGLVYSRGGIQLPYDVVSDNQFSGNPLLSSRWMDGSRVSSRKLVVGFAAILRRHYPKETRVYPDDEAVRVRTSIAETQDGNGLGYDVVPCFRLGARSPGSQPFYLIPDGKDSWLRTDPRIDTELARILQENNAGTYRNAVKLIKYWNVERCRSSLGSYYIELAIARMFVKKNAAGEYIHRTGLALALGFWAVDFAVRQGNQQAWLRSGPPVQRGSILPGTELALRSAAVVAISGWQHESRGEMAQAIDCWRAIFGGTFGE
jgi:hypothetical protein